MKKPLRKFAWTSFIAVSAMGCRTPAPTARVPIAADVSAVAVAPAPPATVASVSPVHAISPTDGLDKAADPEPCDHASESSPAAAKGHDPAHAPIDCPLRKNGVNPSHLKPFAEIDQYIAFLERADRASWQKPDAVVQALELRGNETVYDVGAGSGYFAFRLAKALPRGQVITADVEAEMVRHIHHQSMTQGIGNVHAGFAKEDDPQVPGSADLVFVCDVLHHVADRPGWLAKMAAQMKPGARLVLIEFKEGPLPEGPPEAMKISRAATLQLVETAGLKLVGERPQLLPYQTFLVFEKGR